MQKRGDFIREFFKRWPKFYYFMVLVFGPVLFVNLSPRKFLKEYPKNGKTLNIGSGPKLLAPDVVNVDIYPYENVSIVADAAKLPFEDSSVSRIIYDTVLEHVEDPDKVVAEANRVILPGGYIYITVPLIYPFHSSPIDYFRFTDEGMKSILVKHNFVVVENGVRGGPFSILTLWFSHFSASLLCFGSERLYNVIVNVLFLFLFPIKLLDMVAAYLPFTERFASVLYFVGKKGT